MALGLEPDRNWLAIPHLTCYRAFLAAQRTTVPDLPKVKLAAGNRDPSPVPRRPSKLRGTLPLVNEPTSTRLGRETCEPSIDGFARLPVRQSAGVPDYLFARLPAKTSLIGYHVGSRVLSSQETQHMIYRHLSIGLFIFALAASASDAVAADIAMEKPRPDWIWDATGTSSSQPIYLQKQFNVTGKVTAAALFTVCDNTMKIWVNGKMVGESSEWSAPIQKDIAKLLVPGVNSIAVQAANQGGPAGFTLKLVVKQQNAKDLIILSDKQWKMSRTLPTGAWTAKDYDASKWNGKLTKVGHDG